ncbi:hypothetical protein ACU686_31550 [Yinghuangia aomiensis]
MPQVDEEATYLLALDLLLDAIAARAAAHTAPGAASASVPGPAAPAPDGVQAGK